MPNTRPSMQLSSVSARRGVTRRMGADPRTTRRGLHIAKRASEHTLLEVQWFCRGFGLSRGHTLIGAWAPTSVYALLGPLRSGQIESRSSSHNKKKKTPPSHSHTEIRSQLNSALLGEFGLVPEELEVWSCGVVYEEVVDFRTRHFLRR